MGVIDKSQIRGELIRLKTDLGDIPHTEGLESMHREAVEVLLGTTEVCDLSGVLSAYNHIQELQTLFIKRFITTDITANIEPLSKRLFQVNQLIKKVVVEIANEKCNCRF